ncbi:hypothetical protein RDWZM_005627 [Blomia tropicalis]|uniref:K Homology domain-containing protein n=1 Tax=Blomia tropicalis TaxID=40697 RepID=A0A9Q0M9X8_BLOTA|nr:hypothetical protein RDWZM_005627 [Blomia tropicalis]
MDSSLINFNSPNSSLSANSHKSMIKDLFSLDSSFDLLGSNYHDYDSHGSEISSDFSPVASPINDPDLLDPTTGFNVPMSADLSSQLDTESSVSSASLTNGADTTSMKLFVPTRFIGLVIGRSGNIVRDLQTTHKVYIETPKFELRQYFRIFGSMDDIIATVSAIKALLVAKSGICFKQQLAATGQDEIHLLE